jgi:hypothetical protein
MCGLVCFAQAEMRWTLTIPDSETGFFSGLDTGMTGAGRAATPASGQMKCVAE